MTQRKLLTLPSPGRVPGQHELQVNLERPPHVSSFFSLNTYQSSFFSSKSLVGWGSTPTNPKQLRRLRRSGSKMSLSCISEESTKLSASRTRIPWFSALATNNGLVGSWASLNFSCWGCHASSQGRRAMD